MADRYWVGGTDVWNGVAGLKWSATSGGAGGASVPTLADDVFFDANSGAGTVTATGAVSVARNLSFVGFTGTMSLPVAGNALTVEGSLTLSAGMTLVNGGSLTAIIFSAASGSHTVTTAGKTMPGLSFNGGGATGGTWTFLDAVTATAGTGVISFTRGTLDTNGMSVTAQAFSSSTAAVRTLTLGASVVSLTLNTSGTAWLTSNASNLTLNAGTSLVRFTAASGGVTTAFGGITLYDVEFLPNTSVESRLTSSLTCRNLTYTSGANKTGSPLTLSADITVTGTLTVNGNSVVNRALVKSSALGTPRTITAAVVAAANVDWQDIAGAGGAAPFVGVSMGNALGNSGITFDAPTTQTHTASAGGNWSDATKWTSRVPLPQDDVIVDANTTGTLIADMPRSGASVSFAGYAGSLTVAVATDLVWALYGSLTLGAGMTWGAGDTLLLAGRGSHSVTSNGATIQLAASRSLQFGASSTVLVGTYTLADALTVIGGAGTAQVLASGGTFDTAGRSVTITASGSRGFNSSATVVLGSSVVTVVNTAVSDFWRIVAGSVSGAASTIVLMGASASTRTFIGGSQTYGTLRYNVADSPGPLVVTGANTFAAIDIGPGRTVTLPASTTTTASNGLVLDGDDFGYLYTPDVSGAFVSTPDHASLDITGDVTLDAEVAPVAWLTATTALLVCKALTLVSDITGYRLGISSDGRLRLIWGNGVATTTVDSAVVVPGAVAGQRLWVRGSLDVDNGAGGKTVKFFTSPTGAPGSWTQFDSQTIPGTTSIAANASNLVLSGNSNSGANPFVGKIYRGRVYNGYFDGAVQGGVLVADYDAAAHVPTSDTYTDSTGKVWTLAGLARQGLGRVTLNSSTPGVKAKLSMPAGSTRDVQYTEVVDSDADGTAVPFMAQWPSTLTNTTDWIPGVVGAMAAEVDAALAGGPRATLPGSQATEADMAQLGALLVRMAGDQALEADMAAAGALAIALLGVQADELDQATAGMLALLGVQANEVDTAMVGAVAVFVLACLAAAARPVTLLAGAVTDCEGNTVDEWDVGDVARISVELTDPVTGLAIDPTAITLYVRAPDGTESTPGPAHDGVGLFHADVPVTMHGRWWWRWHSTGAAAGAEEGSFLVVRQRVNA